MMELDWTLLRMAHQRRWDRETLSLYVRTQMAPWTRNKPETLRVIELWPARYDEMKEWPAELLPETHAPA